MPKYIVAIDSGNINLFADAVKLIKYIDKEFKILSIKPYDQIITKEQQCVPKNNLEYPPIESFVSESHIASKEYSINYKNRSLFVNKKDFVKYCFLILEKFNVSDCYGQYKILKRYGCDDEDFFLLFGYSVSDLESIIKGSPYPYVAQRWSQLFSQAILLKEQREQEEATKKGIKELREAFDKEETKTDKMCFEDIKTIFDFVKYIKQFVSYKEFSKEHDINSSTFYNWKKVDPNDASRIQILNINKMIGLSIIPPVKEKRRYYKPKEKTERKSNAGRKKSTFNSIRKLVDCSTVTTIEQLSQLMKDGKFRYNEFKTVINGSQTYTNIRNGLIPVDTTIDRLNEGFGFNIKHYGKKIGKKPKNLSSVNDVKKKEEKTEVFDPHHDERIFDILSKLEYCGTLKMFTKVLRMNMISMKDFSKYFGLAEQTMTVNISRGRPLPKWIQTVFEQNFHGIKIKEENIQ